MTIEAAFVLALKPLAGGRVYADVAPANALVLPRITYQQVGGVGINFLGQEKPSKRNARVQVNTWAETRLDAAALSHQVEDALRAVPTLQVTVISAPVALYEPETDLFGTRQDFSAWTDA